MLVTKNEASIGAVTRVTGPVPPGLLRRCTGGEDPRRRLHADGDDVAASEGGICHAVVCAERCRWRDKPDDIPAQRGWVGLSVAGIGDGDDVGSLDADQHERFS